MAAVLQPGRMTALVPRTRMTETVPHMEELAVAPRPGHQDLRHHTTPAPASMPSPLDLGLLAGMPVVPQAAGLPAGTACPAAETNVILTMPRPLVETTPLPPLVHTLLRPLARQLLADGPKVPPPLVELSAHPLPVAPQNETMTLQPLPRLMRPLRRWVEWLLHLVPGMVAMTEDHGTTIARVRSSCPLFSSKYQHLVLSTLLLRYQTEQNRFHICILPFEFSFLQNSNRRQMIFPSH